MTAFILLILLSLAFGLGYFLYKNQRDKRDLKKLLRDTQAEDDAHDKTGIT
ncbi:MAG: hypothetical protein KDI18_03120 [Gammaproteobacteria bacterium]|nr:hypothetical protein [Gammaproteobacteria bacterium]MCB1878611.1 hypothetical protein [Gammaproteobacteria bacterium]MCB1903092.1 hypothetical protein [Gammaproteobacteria bacterium]MCP5427544.1 hypothetical protein [Chromatiaceae bacterium]